MTHEELLVRHRIGTVTIEGGELVVRHAGTRGVFRKRPWERSLRIPLDRVSIRVAGTDLSIYRDGRIEQMVIECGPADQLARLADLVPAHEPGAEPRTADVLVKTYGSAKEYERDAPTMAAAGWLPQGQTGQQGRVAIGRTAAKAVLTGGIGLAIMGRSRKPDKITVTWVRSG